MRCAIVCDKGFEEILAKELADNYEVEAVEFKETILYFTAKDWINTLATISYTFQGAIKVLSHVVEFKAETHEELSVSLTEKLSDEYQKEILSISDKPIQIKCVRKGIHEYKSTDVTGFIAGNFFKEKDYKSPFIFFSYVFDETGICGIDFAGRELHKRDYKIFLGAQTLRSTVAFGTLLASGITKEDISIDPFMGSGTIPIEAGLYFSKTSPFFFSKEKFTFQKIFTDVNWDEFFKTIDDNRVMEKINFTGYDSLLKFLKNSQKNAKIADINKVITLSKVEVDWLDTKVDEHSVDKLITHPPLVSDNTSLTKILKVYKDFFHIADFLLKENGTITVLTNYKSFDRMKEIAPEFNIKLDLELFVNEGQEDLVIGGFIRG